jgi:phosphoribosylformylglycinamidine synthase
MGFPRDGLTVALVAGNPKYEEGAYCQALAGSQYQVKTQGAVYGRPHVDVDAEASLQRFIFTAYEQGLIFSAHDVGPGGLAVALAESCLAGGIGCTFTVQGERDDETLFGESQSFVVVSCLSGDDEMDAIDELANQFGCAVAIFGGSTGGDRLRIEFVDVTLDELREAYESGLACALDGVTPNA